MPLTVPTPDEIKALRTKLGLTQTEVARQAGVSQPLIARIEKGTVDPRLSTLRAVVGALNGAERQTVPVRGIMTEGVATIAASRSVAEAIRLMREKGFSQLPVVTGKGVPVGSLSERSVLNALSITAQPQQLSKMAVREIMGPPFPTLGPEDTVERAYRILEDNPAILVMERGSIVGLVAKSNILNLL